MLNFFLQIIAMISIYSMEMFESIHANNESTEFYTSDYLIQHANKKTFQFLDNTCSVLDQKQNIRLMCTEEDMHIWTYDDKQVFINKRIPRDKIIKLSPDQYQELFTWISSTKIDQNGTQL